LKRKFTDEEVFCIRAAYANGRIQKVLAFQYGVHRGTITKIVNGVTYAETFTGDTPKPGTKPRLRRFNADQIKVIRAATPTAENIKAFAVLHMVAASSIRAIVNRHTYKDL
jgi:anti-sigma factor ChrR (cupin superfamily)